MGCIEPAASLRPGARRLLSRPERDAGGNPLHRSVARRARSGSSSPVRRGRFLALWGSSTTARRLRRTLVIFSSNISSSGRSPPKSFSPPTRWSVRMARAETFPFLDAPFERVWAFISDPHTLHLWTVDFAIAPPKVKSRELFVVETPRGQLELFIRADSESGVIDFHFGRRWPDFACHLRGCCATVWRPACSFSRSSSRRTRRRGCLSNLSRTCGRNSRSSRSDSTSSNGADGRHYRGHAAPVALRQLIDGAWGDADNGRRSTCESCDGATAGKGPGFRCRRNRAAR